MNENERFQIEQWELADEARRFKERVKWFFIAFTCLLMLLGLGSLCHAYTLDQWADAIRITEGNPNYGVLSPKFVHKRQACKNTVLHAFNDFVALGGNSGDLEGFTVYLANRYCPFSVDPAGNRNWKHNMLVLLRRLK